MKQFLSFGLGLSFVAVVLGELIRLPYLTGNGFLINDLLVGIWGGTWLVYRVGIKRNVPTHPLWKPFLMFASLSLVSLLHAGLTLPQGEWFSAGLYWFRWVEYALMIFIVADLASAPVLKERFKGWMLWAAVALALLGFLQLKFFPDFQELEMEELGWDPHQNRLLSTWFDPNFLGGLFAFMLSLLASEWIQPLNWKKRGQMTVLGGVLLIALFLTYSRSAYLAFMVPIALLGTFKSRKILLGGAIAMVLLVSVSGRAHERVFDMLHSAKSLLVSDATELPDATARLRVQSWENAWVIFSDHPWLGVGFNAYAYVQNDYGFAKSLDVHSASGSDSTALTILATTGVLGSLAYLSLATTLFWQLAKRHKDAWATGTLIGLAGIGVHAFFVNSLLFSPLLIFLYTAIGISLPSAPSQKAENPV